MPFDLPHKKYHVCINDCYIFREGGADKTTCPVCKAARYKTGRNKAPRKVVWYFPLVPRLRRYCTDRKEAKLMRWHAERREKVLKDPEQNEKVNLTHPSDACQWKALDDEYLMHRKCIHELCIIILIFQSYLHHIRVIS